MLSKFTIDASGVRGFLRRSLDLAQTVVSPALLARYGYGEGDSGEFDMAPTLEGDAGGWVWTAKIAPRRFVWTRLNFASVESQKPPVLPNVRWLGPVRGADVTWRAVQASAGRGYFLAGDAAAVLDPASSHGVLRALMSGMMAAHVCASVMSGSMHEDEGANHYRTWLSSWFAHDVRRLRELYGSLGFPATWCDTDRRRSLR
jgi:flavin-dependent dehydrogenase